MRGSRDGAVVRGLPPKFLCPSLIPGPGVEHIRVEFIVSSRPCSKGFHQDLSTLLPPQKLAFHFPI